MIGSSIIGRIAKHTVAAVCMVGIAGLVFYGVMGMNQPPAKKKKIQRNQIAFKKIKKKKKVKARKKVRKKVRRQQVQRRARRAPPPSVGTSLSGIDVGLPSTDPSGFGDLTNALVDSNKALGSVVMDDASMDVPPSPVEQTPPSFPARARAQGLTGFVTVKLLIDQSGAVVQVVVVSSSHAIFEKSAVSAAHRWRFRPGQYKGQAVKGWVQQTIRFQQS